MKSLKRRNQKKIRKVNDHIQDYSHFILFSFLGLSRAEVIGEMLSFLSAGYSTGATALVWFIFLMSKHPHVQTKLKKELSQYDQQRLSMEQLDSLVYLDCVFRELFRFVPPVAGTLRTLIVDDKLPSTGAQLYKGDQVFYSIL